MANGNGDPGSYNQKEILTLFVLPALDEIKEKLDSKASVSELKRLESEIARIDTRAELLATAVADLPHTMKQVDDLQKQLTTPDRVAQMIEEGLRASKSRGWSIREKLLGASVAVMTLITLILNLITSRGH